MNVHTHDAPIDASVKTPKKRKRSISKTGDHAVAINNAVFSELELKKVSKIGMLVLPRQKLCAPLGSL